jgi:hypothetical protein
MCPKGDRLWEDYKPTKKERRREDFAAKLSTSTRRTMEGEREKRRVVGHKGLSCQQPQPSGKATLHLFLPSGWPLQVLPAKAVIG